MTVSSRFLRSAGRRRGEEEEGQKKRDGNSKLWVAMEHATMKAQERLARIASHMRVAEVISILWNGFC